MESSLRYEHIVSSSLGISKQSTIQNYIEILKQIYWEKKNDA